MPEMPAKATTKAIGKSPRSTFGMSTDPAAPLLLELLEEPVPEGCAVTVP